jgi:hypothetical protein
MGDDGARADADAPLGADEDQPPPDAEQDRGYVRGDDGERANPYARDPYARDPYDDRRADDQADDEDDRGPPPARQGRGWREAPPPDDQDDQPPPAPRYQDRPPYSAADEAPRDGY